MIQEIDDLSYLSTLIKRGGEMERIELRPCPKSGTEEAGEWTYRIFGDGKGNMTIVLYYWKGPNECVVREVSITFPEAQEDQQAFITKIAENIRNIREQVGTTNLTGV